MRLFAGHDGGSGCAFYRMQMPLLTLRDLGGWDVTYADSSDAHHPHTVTLADLQGYDVIVAQRWNKHEGLDIWRRARTPYSRLVYELDDDVFNITAENWPAYNLYGKPDIRDAVQHAAEVSDLVTVSTEPLAQVMREVAGHDRVAVLPNCVPGWVLDLPRPRRERPRIGWGGGASHGVDIGQVAGPVRRFLRRFGGWDLQLNGTDYRETIKAPAARMFYRPWVQVNQHPEKFYSSIDFDIGLAPLWPTAFSNSKCVDSSTRISTDQGVLEAGLIEPGMSVWRGYWRRVQAVQHSPERPGLRITTSRGLQVTVTPEHRLGDSDGNWRHARDLQLGDMLQLVQEECPDLPYQRAPWPADGRVTRAGEPDPMAFLDATQGPAVAVTETWGRILGLFTGDGSVGNKTAIRFSCDGQDADLIKMLIADLESAGFRATAEQVTTWGGEVIRKREVRTVSGHLLRFLAGVGVLQPHQGSGWWERTLRVPDIIFRSPESVRAAFIAGLFEADGHVTPSSVALTSKSEDLTRGVQRLLWSIGVPSIVRPRPGPKDTPYAGRTYWQVLLRLEETKLFAAKTGFLSERKRLRVAGILDRDRSRHERVNKNGDRRGCTANGRQSLQWADEITVIEPCVVSPVDIQVEGESYSAAGILSHNSAIKVIEAGARGIPCVATDCPAYAGVIDHGVNGFLVRQDHEWLKYLSELARDEALREKMGAAAAAMAGRHLIEDGWAGWRDAYQGMFRR